jgi:hypothetical protein
MACMTPRTVQCHVMLSVSGVAGGYLAASTAADVINTLKPNPALAGFGFWSVGHDVANKLNGLTWSQLVKALI